MLKSLPTADAILQALKPLESSTSMVFTYTQFFKDLLSVELANKKIDVDKAPAFIAKSMSNVIARYTEYIEAQNQVSDMTLYNKHAIRLLKAIFKNDPQLKAIEAAWNNRIK